MTSLIEMMRQQYPTDADAAARLGISRQAYSQAIKRNRFSNEAALRCAALLHLNPGAALLANCPAAQHIPAPVENPAPDLPAELHITNCDNTNYAFPDGIKKSAHGTYNPAFLHKITSPEQEEAVDLIRWVYAVARLPADSPRFAWYVSRWVVPEKIARAKDNGTFDELTRNCPPIAPDWIRFVPAALQAYRDFIATHPNASIAKAQSSSKSGKARNTARLAA